MKSYQDIASDGGSDVASQLAEQAEHTKARLEEVRHVLAVMSGKGGVGKSTLTINLASALALDGYAVGVVDGDINSPSIARMAGVEAYVPGSSSSGTRPATNNAGLRIMSMSFFLAGETVPVVWDASTQKNGYAWRGLREAGALRSLIADTDWGRLDYLIIDLPPGSDKLGNLLDILPRHSAAIAVTIPSAISAAAVGKSVRMAQQHFAAPLVGLVENMSPYACPSCGKTDQLFPEGAAERLSEELDLPLLAQIPFDPMLAVSADAGRCFVDDYPDRPAAVAIRALARTVDTSPDLN